MNIYNLSHSNMKNVNFYYITIDNGCWIEALVYRYHLHQRLYPATIANCSIVDSFRVHFFFINVCDAWLPSMPSSQITISFWWSSPVTHGQLFNPCVRPADRCIYHHRDGTPISSIRSWFLIPLCHRQWRTDARFIPEQLN